MPNRAHTRLQGAKEQFQLRTNTVRTGRACQVTGRQGTDNSKRAETAAKKRLYFTQTTRQVQPRQRRARGGSVAHARTGRVCAERVFCPSPSMSRHASAPALHDGGTTQARHWAAGSSRCSAASRAAAASDKLGASHLKVQQNSRNDAHALAPAAKTL